jgi:hypothetical protein
MIPANTTKGGYRTALDARRQDPAAAREVVEALLPDERVRRAYLDFLAATIVRCHAFGASRWNITLRQSRKVNLNLGRLLVGSVREGGVFVGLHPDSLPEEDRALLDSIGTKEEPFAWAPEILLYQLPPERFVEMQDRLQAAYDRFLERAAGTAAQTPWARAHSPGVLAYLREECGRALPDPSFTSTVGGTDTGPATNRVYWVNQGRSYDEEHREGCIFAGKIDAGGGRPSHWSRLSELREGDILVHYVSGQIRAVSRVEGPASDATREIDGASREGQRVEVDYEEIESPIPFDEVADELASLDIPNGPIGRDRQPKQGYLWRFSAEGLDMLQRAREHWPSWAAVSRAPRAWIFQGNPKKYDVRGAVRALGELSWMVKQYKNETRPGDTVYLWESGSEGGVVARATILTPPRVSPPDPAEAAFRRDATLQGDADLQVRLRVDARVDPPVGRAQLKAHPALSGCAILRMSQGTNFALSDEEARSLAEIVGRSPPSSSVGSMTAAGPARASVPPPIAPFDAIMGTLERAKLYFSEELVSHYLLALQSKRFVILTGVSGTGKTQLALEVARHFPTYITTQRPAAIPKDAVRVRVAPYMIDYRRIVIPAALAARLAPRSTDGSDRATLRVSFGGREMELSCYQAPSRNVLQLLFRVDFFTWFTEHLDVGDDVYLRAVGAEEGPGHRLEILVPETTTQTEAVENREVVAVRPDWTDGRSLLGYYNPISRRYTTTPFLRLLLRAREEQDRAERENCAAQPFFVVLDEMNLARVEHYFAELLSAMESGEPLVLHDEPAVEQGETNAEEEDDDDALLVPRRLAVPSNLFFTGTVNVDETTHMFSPKVLDRAFVIELNDVDLRGYGARVRAQAALRLPGFQGLSRHGKPDARDWDALDTALRDIVIALNDVLARDNRHFGFRVANEIARFALLAAEQAPEHVDILWAALDLAVLSKVLPKLHGTQQDLEVLLGHLLAFAIEGAAGAASPADFTSWTLRGALLFRIKGEERAPRLPRTAAKLWRMRHRLERQGFTSFIE